MKVHGSPTRSFLDDQPKTIAGRVLDKAIGAYVGTLLKLDKLAAELEANKHGSAADRAKYAAYMPVYHTIVGGLTGAAIGALQTIEDGVAAQTVAKTKGSITGIAAGFLHGVDQAKSVL